MLRDLIKQERCVFHEGFDRWEDALAAGVEPLVRCGAVDQAYGDKIVEAVRAYGPYIVICPDVCLPHASAKELVHQTAVSLMICRKSVAFSGDPAGRARLFFSVGGGGGGAPLENLQAIMALVEREEVIAALCQAKTPEDLCELTERFGI